MLRVVLVLAVGTALAPQQASAAEMQREYRSARHLGMGDAGMAGTRGSDALFYNPAGISEVKSILNEISVLAPSFVVSTNSKDLVVDAQKGAIGGSSGGGEGANSVLDSAEQFKYKPQGAQFQNFSGIVFRRAAFGVLTSTALNALVGSDTLSLPTIDAGVTARAGFYMGAAKGFLGESIMLGFTYKYLFKGEFKKSVGALDIQSRQQELSEEFKEISKCGSLFKCGTANGIDVGAIWKDNSSDLKPRFGIVVKNAGDTTYTANNASRKSPSAEKQSVDVSFGFEPTTKKSSMRLFFDYHDILNRSGETAFKHTHIGGDISFSDVIGVMGGLNQGYPSYGAFANFKIVRIEGGIFTEEVGRFLTERPDKRYFARIMLGWAQ